MSVYEAGVDAGQKVGARKFAVTVDVGSGDFGGRYTRPREDESIAKRIGRGFAAFARLLIPVLLLMTVAGASFAYAGVPAPVLSQSWMNLGLLVLPLTFLAVHLTSRRYGAGYAFAQVLLAYGAVTSLVLFAQPYVTMVVGESHAAAREVMGFAAGLFVAHVVAIIVFDGLRGPKWWQAPLFASLIGGIVLCLIAFPASYWGTGIDWSGRMLDYMGVTCAAAVLLVIPYWVFRPLVPPQPGFGGY